MHRSYLFAPGHNAKLLDRVFDAGGEAIKLPDGEFVDLPVADRARRLIELAGRLPVTVSDAS